MLHYYLCDCISTLKREYDVLSTCNDRAIDNEFIEQVELRGINQFLSYEPSRKSQDSLARDAYC